MITAKEAFERASGNQSKLTYWAGRAARKVVSAVEDKKFSTTFCVYMDIEPELVDGVRKIVSSYGYDVLVSKDDDKTTFAISWEHP